MKTIRTLLLSLSLLLASATASAQPMSYYDMRSNARYLTDRMAYTLGLSLDLIDELYCINYDYICGVNDYLDDVALGYRYDDYMVVVAARDAALRRLLSYTQWRRLMDYDYFYRPIAFGGNRWYFGIYRHDPHVGHFYYAPPRQFGSYRGGHYFGGMDPRGGHAPGPHGGYHFDRPRDTRGDNRGGGNFDSPRDTRGSNRGSIGTADRSGRNDNAATRPSAGNNRSSAARSSSAAANGRTSAVRGTAPEGRSQAGRSSSQPGRSSAQPSRSSSQASRSQSTRSAGGAAASQGGGAHRGGGRR